MKPKHQTRWCRQNIHCIFILTPAEREEKTLPLDSSLQYRSHHPHEHFRTHQRLYNSISKTLSSERDQVFYKLFSRQRRFWKVRKISCTLSHSHSPFFHMRILPSASSLHSKQQLRLSVCKLLFPSCDFKKVILNHLQSHWNNNFFRSLTVILSVPFHTVSYVEQVHLYRWQREFN